MSRRNCQRQVWDSTNLVKVTMIIPDAAEIPASRPARAEALGDLRPASTLILAGLANPAWKIEIEASHALDFISAFALV
jgi:enamine deaminase RidA (YjgF/YER057c/UK114 family)